MDVGRQLREARIRSRLSREELSRRTQLSVEHIGAVEENTLRGDVPGHVYAHVVRRYAAAVGGDADALLGHPGLERSGMADDDFRSEAELGRQQASVLRVDPGPSLPTSPAPPPLYELRAHSTQRRNRARLIALALAATAVAAFGIGAYVYETVIAPSAAPAAADASEAGRTAGDGRPGATNTGPASGGGVVEEEPGPEPLPDGRAAPGASVPLADVSGEWTFTTQVQSSTVEAFEGLRLGFQVHLQQDGDRVSGSGRKVTENGSPVPASRQTPISVSGVRAGERLSLSFTEIGRRRQSAGTFELVRQRETAWSGRFSSDAARSTGTAEARRE